MNDMTDFDKKKKKKAEQASYPYDKAAWRQYKRKTGLHGGAVKYWVVGAASIVAVGTSSQSAFTISGACGRFWIDGAECFR